MGFNIADEQQAISSNNRIHKTANINDTSFGSNIVIKELVSIGEQSSIGNNVTIGSSTVLGKCVIILDNVTIGDDVIIGDNTVIGAGVLIYSKSLIGDNVYVSEFVKIMRYVTIENYVHIDGPARIGSGSCLLRNTHIPSYTVVPDNESVAVYNKPAWLYFRVVTYNVARFLNCILGR